MNDAPRPPEPPPITSAYRPTSNPPELPIRDYNRVPWFRKSNWNSVFMIASLLTCGIIPGTLVVCVLVLSGNIYYNKKDEFGNLRTWGAGNKVVAVILLGINVLIVLFVLVTNVASNFE